jgi:hypothetical protein
MTTFAPIFLAKSGIPTVFVRSLQDHANTWPPQTLEGSWTGRGDGTVWHEDFLRPCGVIWPHDQRLWSLRGREVPKYKRRSEPQLGRRKYLELVKSRVWQEIMPKARRPGWYVPPKCAPYRDHTDLVSQHFMSRETSPMQVRPWPCFV